VASAQGGIFGRPRNCEALSRVAAWNRDIMMTHTPSLVAKADSRIYQTVDTGTPSNRICRGAFIGICGILFAGSVAATVEWCGSMSVMAGMRMSGGWTMSMAWMRAPGQTWPGAGAFFLAMWTVMMIAMMLPSVAPVLWSYQHVIRDTGRKRLGYLIALMSSAYLLVWTIVGIVVFAVGASMANFEMHQPTLAAAVPILAGTVILIAGLLQFTSWKGRHLACCRDMPTKGRALSPDVGTAWRLGLRLGVNCTLCCGGLTAILLVGGVMNLRTMAIVGAAITFERLAPAHMRAAQAIGALISGTGLVLIARAVGLS
jgi:predicted metal-binding membrane protein